jgi:hypothetical protein
MREDILEGKLPLPSYDAFVCNFNNRVVDTVDEMWGSLWHNYCANKGSTSSIHWLEKAGAENTAEFLTALKCLHEWVVITTTGNFSSIALKEPKLLEFVSEDELTQVRFNKRFLKYLPYANTSNQDGLATVYTGGKATAGKLSRPGMEVGAKSLFSFDRSALVEDYDMVVEQARKGIDKTVLKHEDMLNDEANYSDIMDSIIDYLADNDVVCNMGINNVDTRGRAIKSHLSKVMNPVGFKVARALIVIPE